MRNRGITFTTILSGIALVGVAIVGWERLLGVIPFATSSEHIVLVGEVQDNTMAILENTIDDLERAEQFLWDKILGLDLAKIEMQSKDIDFPLGLIEQRARLERERTQVENERAFVREQLQDLASAALEGVRRERQGRVIREVPR